ncbi:MAG TPA: class I SAM-dependent methyltransferase [Mycobacterium sp.]|nr:class I SAM-dependent methyltransferase [Mycobacterium sp.]
MAMNLCHRFFCSSHRYFRSVEDTLLPWALADVHLGDNVLEIGPGYGANIRVLIDRAPHYTAVEIDQTMAERLHDTYSDRARIIRGDGTDTGLPSGEFSAVVCFTMLHHIPTAGLQDRLFAEAFRVLRSDGVFAGSDSASSIPFRVLHFRDICNPVSPEDLPKRLRANGFSHVHVGTGRGSLRWRAVKEG